MNWWQEKSRLQQDEAQLRQQLAEQGRRNDEIAKSLDQVNVLGVLNPGDYTFKLELLDQDGAMGTLGQYPVRVERQ